MTGVVTLGRTSKLVPFRAHDIGSWPATSVSHLLCHSLPVPPSGLMSLIVLPGCFINLAPHLGLLFPGTKLFPECFLARVFRSGILYYDLASCHDVA